MNNRDQYMKRVPAVINCYDEGTGYFQLSQELYDFLEREGPHSDQLMVGAMMQYLHNELVKLHRETGQDTVTLRGSMASDEIDAVELTLEARAYYMDGEFEKFDILSEAIENLPALLACGSFIILNQMGVANHN